MNCPICDINVDRLSDRDYGFHLVDCQEKRIAELESALDTIISGNVYPRPDWADAPSWAKYLAMDSDGCWGWYSKKPTKYQNCFWDLDDKRANAYCPKWETTLESRPKKK